MFFSFMLMWNLTGDTLTYLQKDDLVTISGAASAEHTEKKHHITADQFKAKLKNAKKTNKDSKEVAHEKPADEGLKSDEVWATGNVHFKTGDLHVTASKAYFQPDQSSIELSGNVQVDHKGNTVKGPFAKVDLNKGTYTIYQAKGLMKEAPEIKKQKKEESTRE